MTEQDLMFVAEALIELCDQDRARPCYPEARLAAKLKTAESKDPLYCPFVARSGENDLLRAECDDVLLMAELTPRQREVFDRRMSGWTFEQIGSRSGHSKQAAQGVFVQALKKIARSLRVYRYRGLSDVYRKELRRGARNPAFGRIR